MEIIRKQLGANLRSLRKKRAWTLDQVAESTGVSKAMLGQIERGESNPTVATIWKIANGLKVSFTTLLAPPSDEVQLLKRADQPMVAEAEGKFRVYPIFTFDPVRQWENFTVELEPDTAYTSDGHGDGVEEYLTVTAGTLVITLNEMDYVLEQGDAIRFKANVEHTYTNPSDTLTAFQMIIHYQQEA